MEEAWVVGRNSNRNLVPPWSNVPVQLKSCTNGVAPRRAALKHEADISEWILLLVLCQLPARHCHAMVLRGKFPAVPKRKYV